MVNFKFSVFVLLVFGLWACGSTSKWNKLFEGHSISDFEVLNGAAEFKVVNGGIVGISKSNTPNTFLAENSIYQMMMPRYIDDPSLDDKDIADLVSYISSTFAVNGGGVSENEVNILRQKIKNGI